MDIGSELAQEESEEEVGERVKRILKNCGVEIVMVNMEEGDFAGSSHES